MFSHQYPYLVVIQAIHIVTQYVSITILVVLVYLSTKSIFLDKNEILGCLDKADVGIGQSTAYEPLTLEVMQKQSEFLQTFR